MRFGTPVRLTALALGLPLLGGLACFLGWLKALYFFKTFGVTLSVLDLSLTDYAVESWFVVQNVLFFLLLWWIVLKSRLAWAAAVGILHALIPLAAHYAFALPDWAPARALIHYRHALLKLLPFALLAAIWLGYPRLRERLKDLSWSAGGAALALFAVITLSWAVSTAKHCGSFDANLAIRSPDDHLPRLRIPTGENGPVAGLTPDNDELFLLYADESWLLVWDRSVFGDGSESRIRIVTVPRERVRWFEGDSPFRVQPGSQFL